MGLKASGVSYKYPRSRVPVLTDITAEFDKGVIGLLGSNGAGKTTLIRLLAGLTKPLSGHIEVSGETIDSSSQRSKLRQSVGYLPQNSSWFGGYTVQEFLRYFAAVRGISRNQRDQRISNLLGELDLTDKANVKLNQLSGGQLQRALVGQALIHEPEYLILDEPTAALDPLHRIEMKRVIKKLGEEKTVLLSTHLIDDLLQCADYILVLHSGRNVWGGTPAALEEIGRRPEALGRASSEAESGFIALVEGAGGE